MSLRHPIARARGLGSAKDGVSHWWRQRLSAIFLVPLTLWLLWWLGAFALADPQLARERLAQPLDALLMIAFVLVAAWHAQLGLQVIVEDYVHRRGLEYALQIALRAVFFLVAAVGVLAVLRIALTA
ncbi:MAG: succinate dehydrogenase, hydrophobic membrane anchor protein [Lysobacterales bacterium]|jgi:succinate dehydrogenase / fumarate reductase membrane anchor subunit|nr:MAG: succinate dehydrogenase, hydrophobic membrane anchor protein [Xanthomonadales bacterium]